MTEVHQFWTSPKELVLAVEALAEERAAEEEEAAVVVETLEGADLLAWEDCSRLECPS